MTAPVIHLNGWPGCGKRTFGRVLADRIGGRLIDNHLILDPAVALFARRSPEAAALREAVRDVVHSAALTLPNDIPLVLTDALSEDDHHLAAPSIAFAARRGAPFLPVLLDLDAGENARRLTAPERFGAGKLTDTATLAKIRAEERLLRLPEAAVIDVTDLTAADAARQIATVLSLCPTDRPIYERSA